MGKRMRTAGIIVEYNPFHNGHLYHLEKTREITNADIVVGVMSGNFIQRGEPAIVNKWARTKMAILNGVDVVFELPFAYACNSAEIFAYGAISILNQLGVDFIVFGSECGDIDKLKEIAKHLEFEEDEFKASLKSYLKDGYSFPKARELALAKICKTSIEFSSNNILGIEYIKWIYRLNSNIEPLTIRRIGTSYTDPNLTHDKYVSATAIRKNINNLQAIKDKIPSVSYEVLLEEFENGRGPVFLEDYYKFFVYNAIVLPDFLEGKIDVSEGLENRFVKYVFNSSSAKNLFEKVKTKRYTLTRLQRIFINAILGNYFDQKTLLSITPYIRVLGFNQKGREYLNRIKDKIKYITKLNQQWLRDSQYKELLELEIRSSMLHALSYRDFHKYLLIEFKSSPVYISSRS